MSASNENTQNQTNVKLIRPVPMPVIYVEGISQMILGFPNCRIIFNSMVERVSVSDGKDTDEVHHLACEVVVPTASLIEIMQALTNNMASNKDVIKQMGSEWVGKVNDLVDTLSPPQSATQQPAS